MPIVSREVAGSIIEEIDINKKKRGNSNTMILNGDEVMKNTVHLQISKERHIKKIKKRSFGRDTLSYNQREIGNHLLYPSKRSSITTTLENMLLYSFLFNPKVVIRVFLMEALGEAFLRRRFSLFMRVT